MELRFYLDAETGEPHMYKHRLSEEEVADVLDRTLDDRMGADGSRVALGQTSAGRYLRVVYVPDGSSRSAFVITAYELGEKAIRALRRRSKKW